MEKLHQVIMLPAEKSRLYEYNDKLFLTGHNSYQTKDDCSKPQHIYIISDTKDINDGDWCVCHQTVLSNNNTPNHIPERYTEIIRFFNDKVKLEVGGRYDRIEFLKIVATTNDSLQLKQCNNKCVNYTLHHCSDLCTHNLPQIPESFVKEFIQAEGKVTEVLVGYEECETHKDDECNSRFHCCNVPENLKVDKHNTILIRKQKTS